MNQQTKGYWLFDRNDITAISGEGLLCDGQVHALPSVFGIRLRAQCSEFVAIYKWIEEKN